jgi:ubiquinone/menaquinone biosynthesis C-methylase UbiE
VHASAERCHSMRPSQVWGRKKGQLEIGFSGWETPPEGNLMPNRPDVRPRVRWRALHVGVGYLDEVSWLTAKAYDFTLAGLERSCMSRWRAELLSQLHGEVLELGAGTGLNLEHYPADIESLTMVEPDRAMRQQLRRRLSNSPICTRIRVDDSPAERLQSPNESVDAVVGTLVLCSVQSVEQTLQEVRRVLRPGGMLALIEHVAAPENTCRWRWQKWLEPTWRFVSDGCHLLRDPRQVIEASGFELTQVTERELQGVPGFIKPAFIGTWKRIGAAPAR